MARFGNTGASSLLRTAESQANKTAAYNDAIESYKWDMSEKSAEDYAAYKAYLDKRVGRVQNSDPSKALSLNRTAVSANRQYNSAEISRATTSVKYGNMSNRDKYNQMSGLMTAAIKNGDENLAQRLEGQMSSLSITIQNEEESAARKGEASNNKAMSSNKKQLDAYVRDNFDTKIKEGMDKVEKGELSIQDFIKGKADLLEGKRTFLEQASTGAYGGLSDDAMSSYADKAAAMPLDDAFKKAQAEGAVAARGDISKFLKVDPATGLKTLVDMPKPSYETDAKGNVVPRYQNVWGSNDTKDKREKAIAGGNYNYVFGQVGTGDAAHTPSPVGGAPVRDAQGNMFVLDAQDRKHYINTDPNAPLQRSSTPINDMPDFGPTTGAGQLAQSYNDAGIGRVATATSRAIGKFVGKSAGDYVKNSMPYRVLDSIFNGDKNARKLVAEAQARNNALAAERAKQTKLLPVFRAPAYLPPKPVALPKVAAYKPAPLPGQKGYVSAVDKTKATIANPKSTARDALKSLIGF